MKPEFHYTPFIAKPAEEVWRALTEKSLFSVGGLTGRPNQELPIGNEALISGSKPTKRILRPQVRPRDP